MAVYVDNERNRYGRMAMCHMVADTEDELHVMADRISVDRRRKSKSRSGIIHYDICKSRRKLAVAVGAIEITARELISQFYQQNGKEYSDEVHRHI